MPIHWWFHGDRQAALNKRGLGLHWLNWARQQRTLNNLDRYDYIRVYPDGTVVQINSFFEDDHIHITAPSVSGEPMKSKEDYSTPMILAYKVMDESRVLHGKKMEGWIEADEATLEPKGSFIEIGYQAVVDHYEDSHPVYKEGTNYVERCSGLNSRGEPNCIEEFPWDSRSFVINQERDYEVIEPEYFSDRHWGYYIACGDWGFDQYYSYERHAQLLRETYKLTVKKAEADGGTVIASDSFGVQSNMNSIGDHIYERHYFDSGRRAPNALNSGINGWTHNEWTQAYPYHNSGYVPTQWFGNIGTSLNFYSRFSDKYVTFFMKGDEHQDFVKHTDYNGWEQMGSCGNLFFILGDHCTASDTTHVWNIYYTADYILDVCGSEFQIAKGFRDRRGDDTFNHYGGNYSYCGEAYGRGTYPWEQWGSDFSVGNRGFQYLRMLGDDDYINSYTYSESGIEKLSRAREVLLFNYGRKDKERIGTYT